MSNFKKFFSLTCYLVILFFLILLPPRSADAQIHGRFLGNDCSLWRTCNETLPENTVSVPEHEANFVHYDTTEHFEIFYQTDSPVAGQFDPEEYQTFLDSLECGYRYLVCHLGLDPPSPSDKKFQIYIGDHISSAGYKDYMDFSEYYLGTDKSDTIPTHELFHNIHYSHYPSGNAENITEALATLAEQLPSETNFEKSYSDIIRQSIFTTPQYPQTYSLGLFWRYLFEQLTGYPASPSEIDSDYAVTNYLKGFLNYIKAAYARDPLANNEITEMVSGYYRANAQSPTKTASELYDNFITARYAYRYVNPSLQPQFAFVNKVMLESFAGDLTFTSTSNAFLSGLGGTIRTFDNTATVYGAAPIFGFTRFLASEHHLLQPVGVGVAGGVARLKFTKTVYDNDIRFQLIFRFTDGTIDRRNLLRKNLTQTVTIPTATPLAETVLVIYTVNPNPYNNVQGRNFSLTVQALP